MCFARQVKIKLDREGRELFHRREIDKNEKTDLSVSWAHLRSQFSGVCAELLVGEEAQLAVLRLAADGVAGGVARGGGPVARRVGRAVLRPVAAAPRPSGLQLRAQRALELAVRVQARAALAHLLLQRLDGILKWSFTIYYDVRDSIYYTVLQVHSLIK